MLGLLGSVHGPDVFPYFALGEAVIAVAVLWSGYWFFRRRGYRRRPLLVGAAGLLLVAALIGALQLSLRGLVDWEIAQQERVAAATEVFYESALKVGAVKLEGSGLGGSTLPCE